MKFEEMQLIPPLLKAVRDSGYQEVTPIQRATIPLVLQGKDVLGCAQTGTGKTAAFALPILQLLQQRRTAGVVPSRKPICTLILAPTRELAAQIYESFLTYGAQLRFSVCVIFGGVQQRAQTDRLARGVDILVATPGRLCDLIGQGYVQLNQVEILVLDEADRMLDMGFKHDVDRVLALLPSKRQTLLFSATMPEEVETLANSILIKPIAIKVDPVTSTVDSIRQSLYLVDRVNKRHLLEHLIKKNPGENALVFVRTRHGADRVQKDLISAGIDARAIHGDKSQAARSEALGQFKSGNVKVLVATDIAARGIDIVGLSYVINFDLPNEPEAYIHRIGRTGRAGLTGEAISFCCIDEVKHLREIEALIKKHIPQIESPWPMVVMTPTVPVPRAPRPLRVGMDGQALKPARPRVAQPAARSAYPQTGRAARSENSAKHSPRSYSGRK